MSMEFGFVSSQVVKELEEIGNWKVSHLVHMQTCHFSTYRQVEVASCYINRSAAS